MVADALGGAQAANDDHSDRAARHSVRPGISAQKAGACTVAQALAR